MILDRPKQINRPPAVAGSRSRRSQRKGILKQKIATERKPKKSEIRGWHESSSPVIRTSPRVRDDADPDYLRKLYVKNGEWKSFEKRFAKDRTLMRRPTFRIAPDF